MVIIINNHLNILLLKSDKNTFFVFSESNTCKYLQIATFPINILMASVNIRYMPTVLQPNTKKVFLINLLKILSGVMLLIVILFLLQFTVGLDVFTSIFEEFGITIESLTLLTGAIISIIIIGFFLIAASYFSVMNVKYEVYDDHLTAYQNSMLVLQNSKKIPFQNISKIQYTEEGFFDGLFNTGTILLDLSSMGEKELKMAYIDNPEEVVKYLQDVLRSYNLKMQAQYTERHKIDGILDKGGF